MIATCSLGLAPSVDCLACFTKRKQNTESTFLFFFLCGQSIVRTYHISPGRVLVFGIPRRRKKSWKVRHHLPVCGGKNTRCLCVNLLWWGHGCSSGVRHVFLHRHVSPRLGMLQSRKWLYFEMIAGLQFSPAGWYTITLHIIFIAVCEGENKKQPNLTKHSWVQSLHRISCSSARRYK